MAEEALARIRANLEARMAEREDRSLFDDAARADATTGPAELVALDALSTELRETKGMSTFLRRAQVVRDRKAREQVPDVHGHGATSKKALYDRDDRKSGKAAPADDAAARPPRGVASLARTGGLERLLPSESALLAAARRDGGGGARRLFLARKAERSLLAYGLEAHDETRAWPRAPPARPRPHCRASGARDLAERGDCVHVAVSPELPWCLSC